MSSITEYQFSNPPTDKEKAGKITARLYGHLFHEIDLVLADKQITKEDLPHIIQICMQTVELVKEVLPLTSQEKEQLGIVLVKDVINYLLEKKDVDESLKVQLQSGLEWLLPTIFTLVILADKNKLLLNNQRSALRTWLHKKLPCCFSAKGA